MATEDVNTRAGAGILTEQVVSFLDWLEPEHWPELGARYGYQFDGIYQVLRALQRESMVSATSWFQWEENRYQRSILVSTVSTTTPGAGNPVTVHIDAADHDENGTVTYPRENEDVLTPDEVPAHIITKTTTVNYDHTLLIKPFSGLDDLGDLTGKTLIIFSDSKASGTGQGDSAFVGMTKRQFYAQIFWENIGQEGTRFIEQKWVKIIDDGRNLDAYYNPGLMLAEYRFNRKIDGAFTWGKQNTNNIRMTTPRGASNLIRTTEGMIPKITAQGKALPITPGNFDVLDFDDMINYWKQQGVTSNVGLSLEGPLVAIDIREATKEYAKDGGGTDYTYIMKTMFGGNEALALSVNFKVLNLGDFRIIRKEIPAWSDPTTYAAAGFNMGQYVILGALEKYVDPDSNELLPNIGARYVGKGKYSRRMELWPLAGAGGDEYKPYVTDIDEAMWNIRGEMGFQMIKANRWGMMRP